MRGKARSLTLYEPDGARSRFRRRVFRGEVTSPGDRIHSQFLTGDQSIDEVGAALDRIEREGEDTGLDRLDLLIATSLISHGVDLERINMMVVCGMPSHYAQYVQTSSRCARNHPGLASILH
jgi:superfamily II DNA or RNA helicase